MRPYRCYLLGCRDAIAAVEIIHCAHEGEARRRANDLLVHRPQYHGVEVWDLDRRVYVQVVGVKAE
jgi:hypothetical protein